MFVAMSPCGVVAVIPSRDFRRPAVVTCVALVASLQDILKVSLYFL